MLKLRPLGETLEAGAVFGAVEAVKTVSDLFMPLTGEIIEVNGSLTSEPEKVNTDPYGDGWMIRIKMAGQDHALLSGKEYQQETGS